MFERTVPLKNQISEVGRVHEILADLSSKYGWQSQFLFEVELALEEVLTNVIRYAFEDEGDHEIILRLAIQEGKFIAEVEDDGKEFNPLERPDPELDLPLEERAIGGLGIFLTRKMMNELTYQRKDEKNILTMTKFLQLP